MVGKWIRLDYQQAISSEKLKSIYPDLVAYMADEIRAKNARKIVEAGYGDHLVLSNDISRHTYFTTFDGPGYLAVMDSVVPLMRKEGLSEDMIRKFLIDNPARIVDNPRI